MRLCGMTVLMRDVHPRIANTLGIDELVPGDEHPHAKKIIRYKAQL